MKETCSIPFSEGQPLDCLVHNAKKSASSSCCCHALGNQRPWPPMPCTLCLCLGNPPPQGPLLSGGMQMVGQRRTWPSGCERWEPSPAQKAGLAVEEMLLTLLLRSDTCFLGGRLAPTSHHMGLPLFNRFHSPGCVTPTSSPIGLRGGSTAVSTT